ncbi:hypothetical protein [Micromonospora sp. KC723]|uniref:hypothetical protein n=1 Tax=Micromonospora sp. KC723 TaxID=2530381 RepID=UPI001FB5E77C|nr:hypothetical protein [Micromonospora sp. KC723]
MSRGVSMQPEGPYRFTEMMGVCQVGKAWWAVDGQDRLVTVAVLEPVVAEDPAWRRAFAGMADALAAPGGGGRPYLAADFEATAPWVAYVADGSPGAEHLFRALGHEIHGEQATDDATVAMHQVPPVQQAQPMPWAVQGDPSQGMAPQPVSPSPVSTPPHPVSTPPVSTPPHPVSTPPHPVSTPPVSPAYPRQDSAPPYDPFDPSTGPRIAPVRPEPKRRRDWISVAVALVLTLVAGTAGFFLGGGGGDKTAAPPAPSTSPSLPPYEAKQFAINKAKFEGELAPLAEPWLTRLGGCVVYGEAGAPKLPADEKRHVFCNYGGAWLHFALHQGRKQKDTARAYRQQLNLAGATVAPGMREATRTTGGVTGASGSYVEYAFEGDGGRPICGVWWDRDDIEGAFYVETLCEEGLGGDWDALRDLWRRGS